jgi:hypothetical protein
MLRKAEEHESQVNARGFRMAASRLRFTPTAEGIWSRAMAGKLKSSSRSKS